MKDPLEVFKSASTTGQLIKSWRVNFGVSVEEMAVACAIPQDDLLAIESDKFPVDQRMALRLAAYMGLDPNIILYPNGFESQLEYIEVRRRLLKHNHAPSEALKKLFEMNLPVDSVENMIAESLASKSDSPPNDQTVDINKNPTNEDVADWEQVLRNINRSRKCSTIGAYLSDATGTFEGLQEISTKLKTEVYQLALYLLNEAIGHFLLTEPSTSCNPLFSSKTEIQKWLQSSESLVDENTRLRLNKKTISSLRYVYLGFSQQGMGWHTVEKVFISKDTADAWVMAMQAAVPTENKPEFDDWGYIGGDHYFVYEMPVE